jgi:hypothetical protein
MALASQHVEDMALVSHHHEGEEVALVSHHLEVKEVALVSHHQEEVALVSLRQEEVALVSPPLVGDEFPPDKRAEEADLGAATTPPPSRPSSTPLRH